MTVLEFKKTDEWGALDAIEYAKNKVNSKTPILVLYLDEEQDLNYTSANFKNHQLNYAIDQMKFIILHGD